MEERYKDMISRRDERLGRSQNDKAANTASDARPSTPRPFNEHEERVVAEDEDHGHMYSPTDNEK